MVGGAEFRARIADYLRFNKQEVLGLAASIFVTAFVFSMRDWGAGDTIDIAVGLRNLFVMGVVVAISLLTRIWLQKASALAQGYNAEYNVWWVGLAIMMVVGLLSAGKIPLVLAGGVMVSFMVRHRLGEFRYGFSYGDNGFIASMGVIANIALAILFAVGLRYAPNSYFFAKGFSLNLIMGILALLPFPQLDGLHIFWGSRMGYYITVIATLFFAVLLLSRTTAGLIFAIFLVGAGALYTTLTSSEK